VTKQHLEKVRGYVDRGVRRARDARVDGRAFELQGYENGYFLGGCLFDEVKPEMSIIRTRSSAPCSRSCAHPISTPRRSSSTRMNTGNGTAIFTRDAMPRANSPAASKSAMVGVNVPIPVPMAFHSSAAGALAPSAT